MLPFSSLKTNVPKKSKKTPPHLSSIGDHLLKKRIELKLSQPVVAKMMGVQTTTICQWETNKRKPREQCMHKITAFLGYLPIDIETDSFGGKIRTYRYVHGVGRKELASMLGTTEGVIECWENGREEPRSARQNKIEQLLNICQ